MKKEKTKTIIFTSVLVVVALALIGILAVDKFKQNGTIVDSEAKQIMNDFEKHYKSKEKTVIYYASATCGWCSLQTPILETIAKDYNLDYVYVDISKLGQKQVNEIKEKLNIEEGTPQTIIVENGKVVDIASGFKDAKTYIEFFIKNGLLPSDAVYSKEKNLTFIDYEQYESLIKDKGTNIIVIGQTTCSHCIAIKPALNSIVEEYNLKINYINIDQATQEQRTSFFSTLTTIGYDEESFVKEGKFGTPLTLVLKGGKVKGYITGERSKSQLVKEFIKLGLITE